ncbi:hypothetical protein [Pseudomonas boanensis]|uniref:hypothetical protein n=1 Tax=Metapseudomonas boanensis TaxID=2822138 RepID=UPI0035D44ACB
MEKTTKNSSSFHVVKNGRMLHGNAAFLHIASKVGGVDGFLALYGQEVMKNSLNAVLSEARSKDGTPRIRRVK